MDAGGRPPEHGCELRPQGTSGASRKYALLYSRKLDIYAERALKRRTTAIFDCVVVLFPAVARHICRAVAGKGFIPLRSTGSARSEL